MNLCQCGCGSPVKHKWHIGHNRRGVSPSNKIGISMNGSKYAWVYQPNHPRATKAGYIRRSHLVIEENLGRLMSKGEVVHHINGNTFDDSLENLLLLTKKEHDKISVLVSECCLHPGCFNKHKARGLCGAHYGRYRRSKTKMPLPPSRGNRWSLKEK